MTADGFSALVLAGGRGSRMGGVEKALLLFRGETLLHRLDRELKTFPERFLSTNHPALAQGTGFLPVADRVPGRGPLEGLAAALSQCSGEGLLVVPCDMPFFTAALGGYLLSFADQGWPAWICSAEDGLHPLCGVYRKSCLPALQGCLDRGQFRVRLALEEAGGRVVDFSSSPFPQETFININTPEDLAALERSEDLLIPGAEC